MSSHNQVQREQRMSDPSFEPLDLPGPACVPSSRELGSLEMFNSNGMEERTGNVVPRVDAVEERYR